MDFVSHHPHCKRITKGPSNGQYAQEERLQHEKYVSMFIRAEQKNTLHIYFMRQVHGRGTNESVRQYARVCLQRVHLGTTIVIRQTSKIVNLSFKS